MKGKTQPRKHKTLGTEFNDEKAQETLDWNLSKKQIGNVLSVTIAKIYTNSIMD